MRYPIAKTFITVGMTIGATRSPAQVSEPLVPPVSLTTQIDLINSVLAERHKMFGQPVLIDGCALRQTLGFTTGDLAEQIAQPYRGRVRGNTGPCPVEVDAGMETNTVLLRVSAIRYETTEWWNTMPWLNTPRPTGLMVVRIRVHDRSAGTRTEEWVMAPVRDHVWVIRTVRISGIGYP